MGIRQNLTMPVPFVWFYVLLALIGVSALVFTQSMRLVLDSNRALARRVAALEDADGLRKAVHELRESLRVNEAPK